MDLRFSKTRFQDKDCRRLDKHKRKHFQPERSPRKAGSSAAEQNTYDEVRLPPPKMFQDEPPPPEAFRDPPAILQGTTIDNPLYHVFESVKQQQQLYQQHHHRHGARSSSPKQTKTAPCSPQRSAKHVPENSLYGMGSRHDLCADCYQEGKELLQSTQDDCINFKKCKDEFKRQMCFAGKLYRYTRRGAKERCREF